MEAGGGGGGAGGGGRIERREEEEGRNDRRSGRRAESISELINTKYKLGFIFFQRQMFADMDAFCDTLIHIGIMRVCCMNEQPVT